MATIDTTPKKILDKLDLGVTVTATDLDIRNLSSATDSVAATVSGSVTATIQEPLSVDDNGGSITIDNPTPTNLTGYMYTGIEGSTLHLLTTDVAGDLQVDVKTMPSTAVTNAGTFATQINGAALTQLQTINSLTPAVYDYISLGYTGANLTTVIYKTGGSGGSTISTLTLAYTGSTLISVTKT